MIDSLDLNLGGLSTPPPNIIQDDLFGTPKDMSLPDLSSAPPLPMQKPAESQTEEPEGFPVFEGFDEFGEDIVLPTKFGEDNYDIDARASRSIPIGEIIDAYSYFLESKQGEVQEYKLILEEYQQHLQFLANKASGDSPILTGDDTKTLSASLALLIDSPAYPYDITTEEGKSALALDLALQNSISIARTQGSQHLISPHDMAVISELQTKFQSQGMNSEIFGQMYTCHPLLQAYRRWQSAIEQVNVFKTKTDSLTKTAQYTRLIKQYDRATKELNLLKEGNSDAVRTTYPYDIQMQASLNAHKYSYTCGHCSRIAESGAPFVGLNLLNSKWIARFKEDNLPPQRVLRLAVVFKAHRCPHCHYINILPQAYAEALHKQCLENIRKGGISAKSADLYNIGQANISKTVLQQVGEHVKQDMPELAETLPDIAVTPAETEAIYNSFADVKDSWADTIQQYLETVAGAARSEMFNADQHLMFYGYLDWLHRNLGSNSHTVEPSRILTHVIEEVTQEPELLELLRTYDITHFVVATAEKLVVIIDNLYTALAGNDFISPASIRAGLEDLARQNIIYPRTDWDAGLNVQTPDIIPEGLRALREWVVQLQQQYSMKVHGSQNRIKEYLRNHPIKGPVLASTQPCTPERLRDVPEAGIYVTYGECFFDLVLSSVAAMISEDCHSGLFIRGYGVSDNPATWKKDAGRIIGKAIMLTGPDVQPKLRNISAMVSRNSADFSLQDFIVEILRALSYIDNSAVFSEIVGIPTSHFQIENFLSAHIIPSWQTVILKKLFTYDGKLSEYPSAIVDYGVEGAVPEMLARDEESNDEFVRSQVVSVACDMYLYSPQYLWVDNQQLYNTIEKYMED